MAALLSTTACGGNGWFGNAGPECEPVTPYVEDTFGQLGLGRFVWDCVSDADPTCGSGAWPQAVAVGARFGMTFEKSSSLPSGIGSGALTSASEPLLSGTGTGFQAEHPGTVSVLAPGHDSIIDFIDLRLMEVDRVTLTREQEQPEPDPYCETLPPRPDEGESADLHVGEEVVIQALPYSGSTRLGGDLQYNFKSLDYEVVDLVLLGGRMARAEGISVGTARIEVTAGDYTEIVEIVVTEAPAGWDSGDEDDDDGSQAPHRNKPEPETDSGTGGSDSGGSDDSGSDGDSGSDSGSGGTG